MPSAPVVSLRGTVTATVNLVVSLGLGALFATAVFVGLLASLSTSWIVGLGVVVRALGLRLSSAMAAVDRRRVRHLGATVEALPLPEAPQGASFRQRQVVWGRARWLWRLPAYQLIRLPVAAFAAYVAVIWWWLAVICFVLAGGPDRPVLFVGWHVGPVDPGPAGTAGLVIAGIAVGAAWPLVVRGLRQLDVAVTKALLGPSSAGRLAAEVSRLSEARTLAVESAAAERRRIERDLHDGLQPQLVALALDLGLARSRMARDPASAVPLVERAHAGAKRAAADLRSLVRGIHPSVLDERGLDAALSALVASCPVPVAVTVDVGGPVDPTPEAVAYFMVAEAITNVSKHAQARQASIVISREGDHLRVAIFDDGKGGAVLEEGGGLAGIAARVASIDGTFTLSSSPGGPTRLEAVIPCGP